MLLEHAPVVRRKDLGVSEPLPLEPEIARRTSRRHIEILLLAFAVLSAVEGLVVGLVTGVGWIVAVAALAFAVVYMVCAREFGDAWIVRALRAQPADRPRVIRLTRAEAETAGTPAPQVLVAPGDVSNGMAFALRRRWLVTTQACEELDELELEGLIAHEIVHLRDGEATVAALYLVLAGAPDLVARRAGLLTLISIPLWPAALALRLARGVVMPRDREHRADVAAAMLTRYPPGIVAALQTAGGGSSGVRLLDAFWFVARDAKRTDATQRAALIAEM
jgi:heat shock protein HtpX